jgi:hypothetical protein
VTFTCEDLSLLSARVADAWRAGRGADWSAPAGTLEWTCTRTADHAVDAVLAPAFFLASRRQDSYPEFGVFTLGPHADPEVLAGAVETAARVLSAVVTVAEPDVRAVIWRRPRSETRGPADFVARGALELILHAHDVGQGIGVDFTPPEGLCQRLREHTRSWPMWQSPGWTDLSLTGDAWSDLLTASGRGSSPRLSPTR